MHHCIFLFLQLQRVVHQINSLPLTSTLRLHYVYFTPIVLFNHSLVVRRQYPGLRIEVVILIQKSTTFGKWVFMLLRLDAILFFLVICVISGKWLIFVCCGSFLIYLRERGASVQSKLYIYSSICMPNLLATYGIMLYWVHK